MGRPALQVVRLSPPEVLARWLTAWTATPLERELLGVWARARARLDGDEVPAGLGLVRAALERRRARRGR